MARNIFNKANIHKKVIYDFERRTITAPEVGDTYCFDLVDMNSEKLGKSGYIMNMIDITSRYAQAVAIQHKDTEDIQRGLIEIFRLMNNKIPKKIWSDKEKALIGLKEWLKSTYNIELYHTQSSYMGGISHSVSIVERFNRSMKDTMYEYKIDRGITNTKQLINFTVKNFIPYYNSKIHSTIKMTPEEAFNGYNNSSLLQEQAERANEPKKQSKVLLKVGERVHLQNKKKLIKGKKEPKYSKEIYTITGIKKTNPRTYTLDAYGDTGFYKQQFLMASIANPEDLEDEPDTELESEEEEEQEPVKEVVKSEPRRSIRLLIQRMNKSI